MCSQLGCGVNYVSNICLLGGKATKRINYDGYQNGVPIIECTNDHDNFAIYKSASGIDRATGHGISASLQYLKIYVDWTISALLSNYLAQHFVLPLTHVTCCLALLSAMERAIKCAGLERPHKGL